MILSIDLGTTAVKAALVSEGKVMQAASEATNAYVRPGEQDVSRILAALNDAFASLDPSLLSKVASICIADQMHGIVMWGKDNKISRLVTWEDRRVPLHLLASLNREILKASEAAANPSPPFVHQGYGIATLASMIYEELKGGHDQSASALVSLPLSGFTAAGTIGTWLSHALTTKATTSPSDESESSVFMEVTDAASFGALDLASNSFLLDAVAAGIASAVVADTADGGAKEQEEKARAEAKTHLNRILGSVKVVSAVSNNKGRPLDLKKALKDCDLTVLEATFGGSAAAASRSSLRPSQYVQLSVGDHPASVAGALSLVNPPSDGRTVFLNCGTSLQAACLVTRSEMTTAASSSSTLPDGCEIRPLFRTPGSAASGGESKEEKEKEEGAAAPLLLLAASMNGGNVLAGLAERYRVNAGAGAGDAGSSLDAAFAALEEEALKILLAAADDEAEGSGCISSIRWPDSNDSSSAAAGSWPHPSLVLSSAEKEVRFDPRVALERRVLLSVAENRGSSASSPLPSASPATPVDGAVYACAALAVLHNACALMLPRLVWTAPTAPTASTATTTMTTIILTGSAFAKSNTMKRAADILFKRLLGGAYRLVYLSDEEAASCGAIGAATLGAE